MSLDYYEAQAEVFFAETVAVDMAPLRGRFLEHLEPGAAILDAGCGSHNLQPKGSDSIDKPSVFYRV